MNSMQIQIKILENKINLVNDKVSEFLNSNLKKEISEIENNYTFDES